MKRLIVKLTAFLLFISGFNSLKAQTDTINVVTTAVPFLRISPDARAGGMGDLGMATSADANAGFYNLAKTPFAKNKTSFGLTYTPWLKDLGLNDVYLLSLGGYYKLSDQEALSAGIRYFSLGNIQFTDMSGVDFGEGRPRGHERGALLPHVVALVDDGVDDARVRGGTPDAALLELLHQAGLGVPRRRLRGVPRRAQLGAVDALTFVEERQERFAVLQLGVGVVGAFDVGAQVSRELDGAARRLEQHGFTRRRRRREAYRHPPDPGVGRVPWGPASPAGEGWKAARILRATSATPTAIRATAPSSRWPPRGSA